MNRRMDCLKEMEDVALYKGQAILGIQFCFCVMNK